MTACRYWITVTGLIGPALKGAFSGLATDEVTRHHVLLFPDNEPDALLSVLGRLEDRGIEVDQVTARYR